ncbi:hypothetical protein [Roseomonas xinghualingensis]|uniref:hypothetical protein n=1 Tax=Roseomonas xinghualingensis TaxID=2986475 RepID=UPI0021F17FDF|nr:hypothetical protein [Roseomonas sp. SXEYE001]MCV4209774.1 hypothetical protein [Roseomonas sp. SXEYE001]
MKMVVALGRAQLAAILIFSSPEHQPGSLWQPIRASFHGTQIPDDPLRGWLSWEADLALRDAAPRGKKVRHH